MEIKPATLADARKIAELLTQLGYPATEEFTREKMVKLTGHPDSDLAVAVDGEEVLGFISIHFIPQLGLVGSFARISYLCVDGNARGLGIGGRLEKYCEQLAIKRGCDRIEVHCHSRRKRAYRFYQRQGYEESPKYLMKKLAARFRVASQVRSQSLVQGGRQYGTLTSSRYLSHRAIL